MYRGNGNPTTNGGFYGNSPPSPPAPGSRFNAYVIPPTIPQAPRIGNVTINFRRGGGHSVLLDCNPCPETVRSLHEQAMGYQAGGYNGEGIGRRGGSPCGSEYSGYYASSSSSSVSSFGNGGVFGGGQGQQTQPITAAEIHLRHQVQQQGGGTASGIPVLEPGFNLSPITNSMGTLTNQNYSSSSSGNVPSSTSHPDSTSNL